MKKHQYRIEKSVIGGISVYEVYQRNRKWLWFIFPSWGEWQVLHKGFDRISCDKVINSLTKDLRFDEWEEVI